MATNNSVIKYSKVDTSKVKFDDIEKSANKKYATSKIWYCENKGSYKTLLIQSSLYKVYDVTENNELLLYVDNAQLFSQIDNASINYVKGNEVIKTLSLKNVSYKTIISTIDNNKTNLLRLPIIYGHNNIENTMFFTTKDKKSMTFKDIKDKNISLNNVKVIFEVDGLIVDIEKNSIFTNLILRQVMIQRPTPQKITLTEYSFVDSESQKEDTDEETNNLSNTKLSNHENIPSVSFSKKSEDNFIEESDRKKSVKKHNNSKYRDSDDSDKDSDVDSESEINVAGLLGSLKKHNRTHDSE